jgi:hypothetical protein
MASPIWSQHDACRLLLQGLCKSANPEPWGAGIMLVSVISGCPASKLCSSTHSDGIETTVTALFKPRTNPAQAATPSQCSFAAAITIICCAACSMLFVHHMPRRMPKQCKGCDLATTSVADSTWLQPAVHLQPGTPLNISLGSASQPHCMQLSALKLSLTAGRA